MEGKYTKKNLFLEVIMFITAIIFLFPLYILILNSFKNYNEIVTNALSIPKILYLDNFINAYKTLNFPNAFFNSLIITLFSVIGIVILSSMAAYWMVRRPSRLNNILFSLLVAAMVVPFQSIMIPLMKVGKVLHFVNSVWGLIICYIGFGIPMATFLYHGFIKSVPLEVEEAALIDGCSVFGTFWRIAFPLLKPMTVTIAILNTLWIWNDFLLPSLILPIDQRTIPLANSAFFAEYSKQWDQALAGLLMSVIPIIIFYFIMQKHIIKGIAAGSIK